jgi:serine/threonine protein kinase
VYRARDTVTGRIVALKKVRFDNLEPESVKFMAREILILRRLDHPNVIKLEGLVTSRMSCSLYLVFEYMEHDLAGLAASPDIKFTLPQVCARVFIFIWRGGYLVELCEFNVSMLPRITDKMLHAAALIGA